MISGRRVEMHGNEHTLFDGKVPFGHFWFSLLDSHGPSSVEEVVLWTVETTKHVR